MRTSLYSILCIVIRLGAVLLAVGTLMTLPSVSEFAKSGDNPGGAASVLYALVVLFLVLTATLWIYPGVLARMAAGRASQQIFESPLGAEEMQYIAFSIVGVVFAISGLADLLSLSLRIVITMNSSDPASAALRTRDVAQAASIAMKFALGVGLALGANGLVGWLRRLREQGLPVLRADDAVATDFEDPPRSRPSEK